MLRIAICDDDKKFLNLLHKEICQWFLRNEEIGHNFTIDKYVSSEFFSPCLKSDTYDIVFLDIEMPKLNGIELAKQIRKKMPYVILIFLTLHSEFAPSGYKVRAWRYLSKLDLVPQLNEALSAAVKEFERFDSRSLSVTNYGNLNRIPYRDILYIHHSLRYSEITTLSQGVVRDSRGIKELHEALNSDRFIFIDRSTFINLDHVRRVDGGKIILRSGEHLVISRRMLPQVKMEINRILGGW